MPCAPCIPRTHRADPPSPLECGLLSCLSAANLNGSLPTAADLALVESRSSRRRSGEARGTPDRGGTLTHFEEVLAQSRSLRLSVHAFAQHLDALPAGLRLAVLQNARSIGRVLQHRPVWSCLEPDKYPAGHRPVNTAKTTPGTTVRAA
jgi:hypothetical protein